MPKQKRTEEGPLEVVTILAMGLRIIDREIRRIDESSERNEPFKAKELCDYIQTLLAVNRSNTSEKLANDLAKMTDSELGELAKQATKYGLSMATDE